MSSEERQHKQHLDPGGAAPRRAMALQQTLLFLACLSTYLCIKVASDDQHIVRASRSLFDMV